MKLIRDTAERGTLLLDSLTALTILVIIFAITYPNFIRSYYESQVAKEAGQLQMLAAVTGEYAEDHNGTYPPTGGAYMGMGPDPPYLPATLYPATSASGQTGASLFYYSPNPDDGASFEILDGAPIGVYPSYPALDISYYVGTYKRHDGTPCQVGDYFAIDNVHGVHCTQSGH